MRSCKNTEKSLSLCVENLFNYTDMKKTILFVAVALLAVACNKPHSQSLSERYKALEAAVYQALEELPTTEQRDSAIQVYVTESYALLTENLNRPYSDTLFVNLYQLLDNEQRKFVFGALEEEYLKMPEIQQMKSLFEAEQATAVGATYMDVAAYDAKDALHSLSEWVGKTDYLLVDFWASWCGPCRRLLPHLKSLYEQYHPTGKLQIVGISCDRDTAQWQTAITNAALAWPQLVEKEGMADGPYTKYGVVSIPTTLLIDAEGVIVMRNPEKEELEEFLGQTK